MTSSRNWFAKVLLSISIILGLTLAGSANAANWHKLIGTEPGGTAHTLQVWGFLQPTFEKDYSDPIKGGVGGFGNAANGTLPVPGTLPPDRTAQSTFYMRRARLGIRGTMLPINNDIDYFILTEMGQNGVTRQDGGVHLLDASLTFNQFSRGLDDNGLANLGARIRVGQFIQSATSQSFTQSTPGHRIHIWFPEASFQLALRRLANDNGRHNWPEDEVSVNAGRDVGIQLFDWAEFPAKKGGPWEFTYSATLANGTTIGELNRDDNYRQYYWLSFAKLFDNTRGARRHDAMLYAWYQKGDTLFNDDIDNNGVSDRLPNAPNFQGGIGQYKPFDLTFGPVSCGNRVCRNGNERDYEQKYWGAGFSYFDKPFANLGQMRFEAEYQKQEGLIFDGPQSPSAALNDVVGGFDSILYQLDGESEGWYVDTGYDIHKHLGLKNRTTLNLRYDEFDRNKGNIRREANFKTWTLTGEYFFHNKARLTLGYQFREASADNRQDFAGPGVPKPKTNGNAVLKQVDNRLGVQVTFIYKNVLLR